MRTSDPLAAYLRTLPPATRDDPAFRLSLDARELAERGEHERAEEMRREAEELWTQREREAKDE